MSDAEVRVLSFDGLRDFLASMDDPPEGEEELRVIIGDHKPTRPRDEIQGELEFDPDGTPDVIGSVDRTVNDGIARIGDFVTGADSFDDPETALEAADEQLIGMLGLPASETHQDHHRVLDGDATRSVIDSVAAGHPDDAVVMQLDFHPTDAHSVGAYGARAALSDIRFPADAISNGFESLRRGLMGTLGTIIVPPEHCSEKAIDVAHGDREAAEVAADGGHR